MNRQTMMSESFLGSRPKRKGGFCFRPMGRSSSVRGPSRVPVVPCLAEVFLGFRRSSLRRLVP